jgi:inorganic pyrophosphatase
LIFKAPSSRNAEAMSSKQIFPERVLMSRKTKSLADPVKLQPVLKSKDLIQVIIETPKGSRNKYSFDTKQRISSLKAVLPSGMSFPYDFGFLPRTLAADGDPIDVLLLMDEPAFPGCAVLARLVGVMEGEQIDGKKRIRNDRLIAVADQNTIYTHIRDIGDLSKYFIRQLESFFVNYHELQGKQYKLLGCKPRKTAKALIEKARRSA